MNTRVLIGVGTRPDASGPFRAEEAPSRVEEIVLPGPHSGKQPTQLFLAAPFYVGDVVMPRHGTFCRLRWVTERGPCEMPTSFQQAQRLGRVKVWVVTVTGATVRIQRRRHFRVQVTFPLVIDLVSPGSAVADPDGPGDDVATPEATEQVADVERIQGWTRDLSEGGVGGVVQGKELALGIPVVVRLTLPGAPLLLPGRVVRSRPGVERGRLEVAVQFDDPDEHGDRIRRLLFEQQLLQRRRTE